MNLTEEQIETLEKLAGINYSPEEIAMYFGIDEDIFLQWFNEPIFSLKYHYNRGKLIAKATIDIALLDSAKTGNITAAQMVKKAITAKEHDDFKKRLLNGD